ncbi:hypothetical protein AAFP30_23970 [Gordonia sp. CPCC 205515]|uniref:hypothetical protein n=1 Tax=Gordonia sp. CPCC 205515 TaxID=3140791 RepID=UPI003AF3BA1D
MIARLVAGSDDPQAGAGLTTVDENASLLVQVRPPSAPGHHCGGDLLTKVPVLLRWRADDRRVLTRPCRWPSSG